MSNDWFIITVITIIACIVFASINIHYASKDIEKFMRQVLDEDRRKD